MILGKGRTHPVLFGLVIDGHQMTAQALGLGLGLSPGLGPVCERIVVAIVHPDLTIQGIDRICGQILAKRNRQLVHHLIRALTISRDPLDGGHRGQHSIKDIDIQQVLGPGAGSTVGCTD